MKAYKINFIFGSYRPPLPQYHSCGLKEEELRRAESYKLNPPKMFNILWRNNFAKEWYAWIGDMFE